MKRLRAEDFAIAIAPSRDQLNSVARADRSNPFLTPQYADIRAQSGDIPAIILSDANSLPSHTLAFLRFGRTRRSLHVPSMPPVAADSSFWLAIDKLREDARLTEVSLDSFGSVGRSDLPVSLHGLRTERTEFLVRVDPTELRLRVTNGHRRNINKALRSELTVHERQESDACRIHAALIDEALSRRRGRGEIIDYMADTASFMPLLDGGLARIIQAERLGRVIASALYLTAETGVYYHTAGSSEEGAACGASPFLVASLVDSLRDTPRTVLNLGGARSGEKGLHQYKREFRSTARELVSLHSDSATLLRRVMNACTSVPRFAPIAR